MTIFLRQSTASQEVILGRFLDSTDGNTEETGLTIANTDIKLWKSGATTLASKNSGGATHIANGIYYCVLDATDTDTIGPMEIHCHPSGALAVRVVCCVLDEAVYDVLFGTTAPSTLAAGALMGLSDGAITSAKFGTDAISAAALAADAGSEIGAAVKTAMEAAGSHLALIKAKTDNLPADPADDSDIDAQLATIAGYIDTEVAAILAAVDTEVAAIKAKTDQLNFSGTDVKATLDGETVTVATNNDKTGYALTSAYDAAKTAAAPGAEMALTSSTISAIRSGLSTLTAQQVWEYASRSLTTFGSLVSDIATAVWTATTRTLTSSGSGGATAQEVWEYANRTLTALDEDATTLDLNSTIAAAVPSASSVASAVRTELSTELSRIDANVSSRSTLTAQQVWEYTTRGLTTFGTLVSDIASAVWSAVSRTLTGNVTVGGYASGQSPADLVDLSDLAQTGEAAAAVATLNNLSSAQVQAAAGAALTSYGAAKVGDIPTPPSTSAIASQVRTELSTELARMDANVSSRLAATSYSTPPSAAAIASQVRSEIATELSRLDASVSSRLATSGYTAPPSASAVAAAVWSAVTRTLTSVDVDVDEAAVAQAIIDAIGEQGIEVDTAAIAQAVIAGLGALTVTVTSPVATDGTITIYQGDDYVATEGRALTFAVADAAHLLGLDQEGASATLKLQQATWAATDITETTEGYDVIFEPTAEETAALTELRQSYELECVTAAGSVVTTHTGFVLLVRDIPVVS